jgi:hypothetical protein
MKVVGKRLPIALTADSAGTVRVALLKSARIVAKGGKGIGAGTVGFRLKLPRALKPGSYTLKISFTPQAGGRAVTKTLAIRFTGRAAKTSVAGQDASGGGPGARRERRREPPRAG